MTRRRVPAAQRKASTLGLVEGFTKPMLDAMNRESKARYRIGIGALTKAVADHEKHVESLESERPWWSYVWPPYVLALREARRQRAFWKDRLETICAEVARTPLAR